MKKLTIPCDFRGVQAPFTVYIGNPGPEHHPLQFQAKWLGDERGGTLPEEFMNSLGKLQEIAKRNSLPFEDLCAYAMTAASAPAVAAIAESAATNNKALEEVKAPIKTS